MGGEREIKRDCFLRCVGVCLRNLSGEIWCSFFSLKVFGAGVRRGRGRGRKNVEFKEKKRKVL